LVLSTNAELNRRKELSGTRKQERTSEEILGYYLEGRIMI
jgi:hypothetical protein